MALTINDPEVEIDLAEQAHREGLPTEIYLKQLIRAARKPQGNPSVELPRLEGRVIGDLSRRDLYEDAY